MNKNKNSKSELENLDKSQLSERYQEILVKESREKDKDIKKSYQDQRLEIEHYQKIFSNDIQVKYVAKTKDKAKPTPYVKNCLWAFGVGGTICTIGQALTLGFQGLGLEEKVASTSTTCVLIVLAALLTGFGVYDEIGRRAGAGSIVPVTGFSNSIVSAALEAKYEGIIYGVGAKIFSIAGPVIVYGTVASIVVGFFYLFLNI